MMEAMAFNKKTLVKESSERIQELRARLMERMTKKIPWWRADLTVLNDEEVKSSPLIIRKAKAVEKVLKEMPIAIFFGELIVGVMRMHSPGCGQTFPDYANETEKRIAAERGLSIKSVWGHLVPNHSKVLNKGLHGIRMEVERRLRHVKTDEEEFFLQAIVICCNAVVNFAKRYSVLALELRDRESDEPRKKELEKIAQICLHVPEHPARNFHEAIQSSWFTHLALQSTLDLVPFGRMDQFLYPFLKGDLDKGILTYEKAQELIECLWIKFNELVQIKIEHHEDHSDFGDFALGRDPDSAPDLPLFQDYAFGNEWLQTVTLGGQTAAGKDATNELSYMILKAGERLELIQPTIYVRLSNKSPQSLLEKSCELIRKGGGMPVIYNDEVIIPALVSEGIPDQDAREFSSSGCWEILIPAKMEYRWSPIHALKCLEWVFNRGKIFTHNRMEGLDSGEIKCLKSFNELIKAFKFQLSHYIKKTIDNVHKYYGSLSTIAPDPFLSALIDDCIEKGCDITEGGAKYIFHGLYLTGGPNVADAFSAIRKFVFEEKMLTLEELRDVLCHNFEGREDVRQKLLMDAPKFGNDFDTVDQILVEIVDYFVKTVKEYSRNSKRIKFPCGVGTMPEYKIFGKMLGASADGRKSGEYIAPNMSPHPGRNTVGPTATVKSYTKVNHLSLGSGAELDLTIDPKLISGDEGLPRLMGFIKSFLDLGGSVISINVTNVETLLKAQKEPEKYRNLRVRMAGWQAYFISLDKEHQDIHIRRVMRDGVI